MGAAQAGLPAAVPAALQRAEQRTAGSIGSPALAEPPVQVLRSSAHKLGQLQTSHRSGQGLGSSKQRVLCSRGLQRLEHQAGAPTSMVSEQEGLIVQLGCGTAHAALNSAAAAPSAGQPHPGFPMRPPMMGMPPPGMPGPGMVPPGVPLMGGVPTVRPPMVGGVPTARPSSSECPGCCRGVLCVCLTAAQVAGSAMCGWQRMNTSASRRPTALPPLCSLPFCSAAVAEHDTVGGPHRFHCGACLHAAAAGGLRPAAGVEASG